MAYAILKKTILEGKSDLSFWENFLLELKAAFDLKKDVKILLDIWCEYYYFMVPKIFRNHYNPWDEINISDDDYWVKCSWEKCFVTFANYVSNSSTTNRFDIILYMNHLVTTHITICETIHDNAWSELTTKMITDFEVPYAFHQKFFYMTSFQEHGCLDWENFSKYKDLKVSAFLILSYVKATRDCFDCDQAEEEDVEEAEKLLEFIHVSEDDLACINQDILKFYKDEDL